MPRFIFLQLHLLVLIYGSTAILGQLISLPAPALVVWRSVLAAAGGAVLITALRPRSILPPLRQLLPLIGIGAIVGLHWLCFFGAIRLSNISICLAGMATTSFFTAFSEPLVERRTIRPLEVLLGLLVVLGIILVANFERGRLAGLTVALLGALLASLFPVLNRRLLHRQQLDPLVMMTWEMVGVASVCLLCLPWLVGPGAYLRLFALTASDVLWLLLLAWGCTVFAYAFHIHLLRHLSAYTTNLAINFEPIYGILAAALLFGEHRHLHPGFFLGAATIIFANLAHPLVLHHFARSRPPRV